MQLLLLAAAYLVYKETVNTALFDRNVCVVALPFVGQCNFLSQMLQGEWRFAATVNYAPGCTSENGELVAYQWCGRRRRKNKFHVQPVTVSTKIGSLRWLHWRIHTPRDTWLLYRQPGRQIPKTTNASVVVLARIMWYGTGNWLFRRTLLGSAATCRGRTGRTEIGIQQGTCIGYYKVLQQ